MSQQAKLVSGGTGTRMIALTQRSAGRRPSKHNKPDHAVTFGCFSSLPFLKGKKEKKKKTYFNPQPGTVNIFHHFSEVEKLTDGLVCLETCRKRAPFRYR